LESLETQIEIRLAKLKRQAGKGGASARLADVRAHSKAAVA
jgi:hypothetical protein